MKFFLVLCALVAMSLAENVQKKMVKYHNIDRKRHNSPPLRKGSKDLIRRAQNCAKLNANRGYIAHDCPDQEGYGENIAMSTGALSAKKAYQMWYDEYKDYDYSKPGFSEKTGHFTQVVWKGSKKIGCGYAKNKITVISCLYSPPGNYEGKFRDNVIKPSD